MPERKLRPYLKFSHKLMRGPAPVFLALIAILAGLLVVSRLSTPQDESWSLESLYSLPSENLSRRDLKYYVRALSNFDMGGRESGKPTGKKATDFLLKQYNGSDLPGYFNGDYVQEFSFPAGIEAGRNSRIRFEDHSTVSDGQPRVSSDDAATAIENEVHPSSEETDGSESTSPDSKAALEVVPVAFSSPSSATATIVFGGFCVSAPEKGYDELSRFNALGKIVLCLRYGPGGRHGPYNDAISFRAKYEALKRRGAAGIVFLDRPGTPPVYAEFFGGSDDVGPPSVFADAQAFYNRYHWLKKEDAKLLDGEKPYSEHLGREMGRITVQLDYRESRLTGRNVAASIKGSFEDGKARERKWIVVGAHYDHLGTGKFGSLEGAGEIHNGADDNASGTAAVLELAFSLRQMYAENPSILPEPYDVVFIHFDAEERGLFGSEHFVKSPDFDAENTVAMLNLDMVGMLRSGKGLQLQGAQTADSSWKQMIEAAYRASGFAKDEQLRFFPGGNGPSDHSPFYRKGIPVAFFFTGEHSHYHRSTDDFERLNFEGLYHISVMARALILNLVRASNPPVFQEAPEVNRSDLEFDVRLGIIPGGYGETEGGLLVAGVKQDTPVSRTGIQKGDRIIFLGGQNIENIQDLTEFLYNARLNQSYEIRFKRGEQIIKARTELISGGAH
ncbi:MAG: M28 family peptidase [Leptospiraceae bacterium]|nr:M28 family peptidase [Leptospiraceae bacterium]